MEKDEILEKSRKEKRDEGKEFIFDKGRKSGTIGMMAIFFILAVYNLYTNHKSENFALLSVIFGYLSCESFGMYYVTKRKFDILNAIVGAVICICSMVTYFIGGI